MPRVTLFEQSPPYSLDIQRQRDPDGRVHSYAVQIGRIILTREERAIVDTLCGDYRYIELIGDQVVDHIDDLDAVQLTPQQLLTIQAIYDAFVRIEAWDNLRSHAVHDDEVIKQVRFGNHRPEDHILFHREGIPDEAATVRSVAFGRGGPTRLAEGFVDPGAFDDYGYLVGTPEEHGLVLAECALGVVTRVDSNTVHASSASTGPRLFMGVAR